jgi:hypothetical protein
VGQVVEAEVEVAPPFPVGLAWAEYADCRAVKSELGVTASPEMVTRP